jgi:phosphate/sulfate permease
MPRGMVWAWVLTLPAAALIAWLSYFALHFTIVRQ